MPFDIGGAINAGVQRRKAVKGPFESYGDTVLDAFKTKQDTEQKLGLEVAKSQFTSPVDQSTIAKNYATAKRYEGAGGGRNIFLVNRRTGKIHKAGDQTMGEVDPTSVGQLDRIMSVDIPSATSANMFNQAQASTKQIDDLIGYLEPAGGKQLNKFQQFVGGFNKPALRPIQGTQSIETQDYALIRNDYADRLLRLRSGAQINEPEFQRLMNLLPQWWRNDKSDVKQLKKFRDEYKNLMNGLQSGQVKRADVGSDASSDNPGIEQQYDSMVESLVAGGMDEEEAQAQADREFGL